VNNPDSALENAPSNLQPVHPPSQDNATSDHASNATANNNSLSNNTPDPSVDASTTVHDATNNAAN
jgi:hypothetical protein